jgi:predicted amidohydrolase YtcJ
MNANAHRFFPAAAILLLAGCGTDPAPAERAEPEQAASARIEHADLALMGGAVLQMSGDRVPTEAIAVKGDRILRVGTAMAVREVIGPDTEVIDIKGQLALPGFIDTHLHFLSIGAALTEVDLTDARNWDEILARVEAAAKESKPGEWIVGRGWHQEKWDERPEPNVDGLPHHDALSALTPHNPVALIHASGGHAVFANGRAMALSGIDDETIDPEGGTIVRDRSGKAIGAFREAATALITGRIDRTGVNPERLATLAGEECLRHGVTTVHDAGTSLADVELYKRLVDEGKLAVRLHAMLSEPNEVLADTLPRAKLIGYGDDRLTVRSIKRVFDGALGSHGAWLLAPYDDLPGNTGLNTEPIERLAETARLAAEHGFQLGVHAIGDRANREVLDLYERTFAAHPRARELRWRIEHAQHLHPDDIPRFGKLGVIAAMQPCHCTSDGPWVPTRLGAERSASGAYVWRALIDSGALLVAGTDAPIEPVDPIANLVAATTRRMKDGEQFHPRQRMTHDEALAAYTIHAARAGFEEQLKGSLTKGKLADIVVLTNNFYRKRPEHLREAEVALTIVGGKVVYRK